MNLKLSVIMPVYNEINTISKTLENLHDVLENSNIVYEIIIIESGSTDGTHEYIETLSGKYSQLILKFQDRPLGKGNAVRYGMCFASGDIISIFDGDDEYDASDLIKLFKEFENPAISFVLGSRHDKTKPMRVMKNFKYKALVMNIAHKFFTFLINKLFAGNLEDPFTMYKLWRREIFDGLTLTGNRFDLDWELVCLCLRKGIQPSEIPVNYVSRDFASGKKITFIRDPITWMLMLIKCKFRSLN